MRKEGIYFNNKGVYSSYTGVVHLGYKCLPLFKLMKLSKCLQDTVVGERDYLKEELGMFIEQIQSLEKANAAMSQELQEKRETDEFESLEEEFRKEHEVKLLIYLHQTPLEVLRSTDERAGFEFVCCCCCVFYVFTLFVLSSRAS